MINHLIFVLIRRCIRRGMYRKHEARFKRKVVILRCKLNVVKCLFTSRQLQVEHRKEVLIISTLKYSIPNCDNKLRFTYKQVIDPLLINMSTNTAPINPHSHSVGETSVKQPS